MKLAKVAGKVHKASKQGALWMNQKVATTACNPKKAFYNLHGHVTDFEGDAKEITCEKCKAKLPK
jgi:hypothetical protein